ncbi:hypothetical protein [Cytobacillus horneckiae]|uniref:hypothetical protein n=1 Tax=Cytobacillus horneckiae TaxID=549687 RepID=UPI000A930FC6|nr:hypothetical protein [Cytobacillus horneckiae]MED2940683.1 hypothetical protein [Cytobacillus horneckiae]
MNNQTNVVLPAWIFEQAKDKEELKRLVVAFIKPRYEGYTIKKITKDFAVCDRG